MTLIRKAVKKTAQAVPLHLKYRPATFDDVLGQDAVCANLAQLFRTDRVPHSFLFTGPSGTGKTTLARIIARQLNAEVIEVDAARYSGIDAVRELISGSAYQSFSAGARKVFILDECHALSKAAWQTFLKTVEEPQDHLYWIFCTTEAEKVPKTIMTRCHAYAMRPVRWEPMSEFMAAIAQEEELTVKPEFIDMAARRAEGSVRQALQFLSMLDGIDSQQEAARVMETALPDEAEAYELGKLLIYDKAPSWERARALLEKMADVPPESIRLTVVNMAANAIAKEAGRAKAAEYCAVLQAFSTPCVPSEKMAPIYLAVGALLLNG